MLARALDSVALQTFGDFETIVVDDGSTDGTIDLLESRNDLRVFRTRDQSGAAAARNIGIEAARGEYVAFLDSDDEWLPEKLSKQLLACEGDPEVGAIYCRHIGMDDETGSHRLAKGQFYRGWIRPILLSGRCPHTTSLFLVRRKALEECGGFDPRLAGFQDTDLWIRMSVGWKFDFVDEPLAIVHSHRGQRLTTSIGVRTAAVDAFLAKWGPEMEQVIGSEELAKFRAGKLAAAQGARVLELVETGNRRVALAELRKYIQLAGVSNPRQLGGLALAVALGPGSHTRIKAMLPRD
jgi:glycosyltransferase involved in cell wall biosynthesis